MVFRFAPCGGATKHREMHTRLKRFLKGDWENLQEEFFLQNQVLLVVQTQFLFPNMIFQLTNACSTV
jgi:hypothetical protein